VEEPLAKHAQERAQTPHLQTEELHALEPLAKVVLQLAILRLVPLMVDGQMLQRLALLALFNTKQNTAIILYHNLVERNV
jgi:hypothetical protein